MDKWLQRWPQWPVLERFIETPQQRLISVAWFSLLQEYEDIFNVAGDPTPADAKLAWWVEELHDWSRQRSRHPLAKVLQPLPVPWGTLADILPELIAARRQPDNAVQARTVLYPFAHTVASIENALFSAGSTQPSPANVVMVINQLLAQRSQILGAAAMPLEFNQLSHWQHGVLDSLTIRKSSPRPRRLYASLARLHLKAQLAQKVKTVYPLQVLWHGWRAAQG